MGTAQILIGFLIVIGILGSIPIVLAIVLYLVSLIIIALSEVFEVIVFRNKRQGRKGSNQDR